MSEHVCGCRHDGPCRESECGHHEWRDEQRRATAQPEPAREAALRAQIERDARLDDALDALRAAVLWLHGDYRDKPRSEFNAEGWYRKARSGIVGLARLSPAASPSEPKGDER